MEPAEGKADAGRDPFPAKRIAKTRYSPLYLWCPARGSKQTLMALLGGARLARAESVLTSADDGSNVEVTKLRVRRLMGELSALCKSGAAGGGLAPGALAAIAAARPTAPAFVELLPPPPPPPAAPRLSASVAARAAAELNRPRRGAGGAALGAADPSAILALVDRLARAHGGSGGAAAALMGAHEQLKRKSARARGGGKKRGGGGGGRGGGRGGGGGGGGGSAFAPVASAASGDIVTELKKFLMRAAASDDLRGLLICARLLLLLPEPGVSVGRELEDLEAVRVPPPDAVLATALARAAAGGREAVYTGVFITALWDRSERACARARARAWRCVPVVATSGARCRRDGE